jgi:UDP-4-amino-4,6-dideoxy-N-acetyl-beta-L-altrosamine transaminase
MPDPFYLPYARQTISREDIQEVEKALNQPFITRGPLVEQFEQAIAAYCGAEFAVAFNSGTSALMASYSVANVNKGDFLISTPNTFIATVGAAVQKGACPVFLDIDRSTGNFNLEQLAININHPSVSRKTVIAPVHFGGIPVDVQEIYQMISDTRTVIIEDACQALGSRYKDGSMVGSCRWSDMTVFSFHPAKIITTGEGGAVTTNDPSLYHRLQLFRNNGIERNPQFLVNPPAPWYYEVVDLTGNFNFTEIQAALGLSQLSRIDSFINKRRELMNRYQKQLKTLEHVKLLTPDKTAFAAPHLCVVQIDFEAYKKTRAQVMEELMQRGIGTQVHYIPVYRHPYFAKEMKEIETYFPEMETYYAQALSLPLFYTLTEENVQTVVKELKNVLHGHSS